MFLDHRICSAARAWLRWSQEELAKRSNVHLSTVRALESGEKIYHNNEVAMQRAFQEEGMVFSVDAEGNLSLARYDDEYVYEITRRKRKVP